MPTKLITKNSSTASAVPTAGQLDQGELAVNVTDKRLFTKDSGGTVLEIGTNPTSITTGTIDATTITADGLNIGTPNDLNSAQVSVAAADNAFIEVENKTTQLTAGFMWTNSGSKKWTLEKTGTSHNLFLQNSADTTSVQFHQNNDISFYEDTGTTAKFFWDASAERLGLGTTTPATDIHIANSGAAQFLLQAGAADTCYFLMGDAADTNIGWIAYDNSSDSMNFRTNNAERMRIDSSGNVGIGTSSPAAALDVAGIGVGASAPTIRITSTADYGAGGWNGVTTTGRLQFYTADPSGNAPLATAFVESQNDFVGGTLPNGCLVFGTATYNDAAGATERMRIDSSGNLLVGTTDATQAANTSGSGIVLLSDGGLEVARDTYSVAYFNKTSTADGTIISLLKQGTTVGSIGTNSGFLTVNSGDIGLLFNSTDERIYATNGATGVKPNAVDLGDPTVPFKDLYLSGGVKAPTGDLRIEQLDTAGDLLVFSGRNIRFGSGNTADTMRLDSSGNLLVGTTTPAVNSKLTVNGNILLPWAGSGVAEIGVAERATNGFFTNTHLLDIHGADAVNGSQAMAGGDVRLRGGYGYGTAAGSAGDVIIQAGAGLPSFSVTPGVIKFETGGTATERARIDSSGNLLVGRSNSTDLGSPSNTTVGVGTNGAAGWIHIARNSSNAKLLIQGINGGTGTAAEFISGTTAVGTITYTASATAYNTSSDYRLKENVVPMDNASDRVLALKPCRFNFIADPDNTVDGFLAHEAQEVVPEAVHGVKDGMRTEEYEVSPAVEATYDEEGNELTPYVPAVMGTREVPDYQGIDQSKLVPLLTKALQEALERIAALEAKVG